MRTIMQILLLSMCGWCAGEPLGTALARRRDASVAYASAFAREYEPYVFAAVPLHAPVPVLHVLSPAPLSVPPPAGVAPPPRARPSVRHTPFTRPYDGRPYAEGSGGAFAEPHSYADVRHYQSRPYVQTRYYGNSRPYADAVEFEESAASPLVRPAAEPEGESYEPLFPRVSFTQPPPPASLEELGFSSQEAPAVLYARPSLSGGYTYRKVAARKAPPKKTPAKKEQPVFVKIHKHKIVKS